MISQITPAGEKPASLAKSIAASVCPVLLKTPPSFAINGKMVLKSVNLVDFKSDTIVSLDKVESSFFPLFQREPKIKELIIEGLKIDSNFPNNDKKVSDIKETKEVKLNIPKKTNLMMK